MTLMRAKMRIGSVIKHTHCENLQLFAVGKNGPYDTDGADENNTFAKFTPSADMTIQIANPDLFGKFEVDDEFYLDFTKVEKAEAENAAEAPAAAD